MLHSYCHCRRPCVLRGCLDEVCVCFSTHKCGLKTLWPPQTPITHFKFFHFRSQTPVDQLQTKPRVSQPLESIIFSTVFTVVCSSFLLEQMPSLQFPCLEAGRVKADVRLSQRMGCTAGWRCSTAQPLVTSQRAYNQKLHILLLAIRCKKVVGSIKVSQSGEFNSVPSPDTLLL